MTVETAILLAKRLHEGQVEKYAPETPFFVHLERVASRVMGETAKVVAYLHDSVEDGKTTLAWLEAWGVTPEQLEAIELVSRRPGESYVAYIERIKASGNAVAREVKLADLTVHFAYGEAPESLLRRYERARDVLTNTNLV